MARHLCTHTQEADGGKSAVLHPEVSLQLDWSVTVWVPHVQAGYNWPILESRRTALARILLVEDEEQLCKLVSNWLTDELHIVESCSDGSNNAVSPMVPLKALKKEAEKRAKKRKKQGTAVP